MIEKTKQNNTPYTYHHHRQQEHQSMSITPDSIYNSPTNILPIIKTMYFYDGHNNNNNHINNPSNELYLTVQSNIHRSLEALLNEFTNPLPPYSDTQMVYTYQTMNKVKSMNDLQLNNPYENTMKNRKLNNKMDRRTDNKSSFLLSSSSLSSSSPKLYHSSLHCSKIELNNNYKSILNQSTNCIILPTIDTLIIDSNNNNNNKRQQLKQVKRIYVHLNKQFNIIKPVLIKSKYIKTIDNILQELSELFQLPIHKLYTLDGKLVSDIIINIYYYIIIT
ncbi:unnamed protein product [Schistosoma mattheei]|uniref:Uncharacterized protein n=1 Tax=Schistosoma mattheei TaxID=31246 RepID=A0A183PVR5_9TREM|nr:unnamed protein product [Schistosoma mattheei]